MSTIHEWISLMPILFQWVSGQLFVVYLLRPVRLVLNPCIRMTWIRQNWDENYIAKAEQIVKETVSAGLPISRPMFIYINVSVP